MKSTESPNPPSFERLLNFRDVGGCPTTNHETVRPAMLFRSEALGRVSKRDLQTLQDYRLQLICDLRVSAESLAQSTRLSPLLREKSVNVPLSNDETDRYIRKELLSVLHAADWLERFHRANERYYHHIVFERMNAMARIFALLSEPQNYPALIHCSAGKDRTGVIAALVQWSLGVSHEHVRQDYLLSNDRYKARLDQIEKTTRKISLGLLSAQRLRIIFTAHGDALDCVYEQLIKRYGSVQSYLVDGCKVPEKNLVRMRELLLTSTPAS